MARRARSLWRSWSFVLAMVVAVVFTVILPGLRMLAVGRADLAAAWLALAGLIGWLLYHERFALAFLALPPAILLLLQIPMFD